jgi:hypothetical protein
VAGHTRRDSFVVRAAAVFDTDSWDLADQGHKAADLALDSLKLEVSL